MKLNAIKIGIASAAAFTLLWFICSLMIMTMPEYMRLVTASMMHVSPTVIGWELSWSGVLVGGVAWAAAASVTFALTAALYNLLTHTSTLR